MADEYYTEEQRALLDQMNKALDEGREGDIGELLMSAYDAGLFDDAKGQMLDPDSLMGSCTSWCDRFQNGEHRNEYALWFTQKYFSVDERTKWGMGHPQEYRLFLESL